jgi:hypothetical protein
MSSADGLESTASVLAGLHSVSNGYVVVVPAEQSGELTPSVVANMIWIVVGGFVLDIVAVWGRQIEKSMGPRYPS